MGYFISSRLRGSGVRELAQASACAILGINLTVTRANLRLGLYYISSAWFYYQGHKRTRARWGTSNYNCPP